MRRRIFAGLLTLVAAALSAGCGEPRTDTDKKQAAAIPQTGKSPDPVADSKKGPKSHPAEEVPLPEDFPKDVPIFPNAVVYAAGHQSDHKMGAGLTTSEAADGVIVFYKAKLKENGWAIDQVSDLSPGGILQCSKDGRRLLVNVYVDSGQTKFSLALE